MPAVGITDTNNLFGALEFSEKLAGSGIQPIVGCALNIDFRDGAAPRPAPGAAAANEPQARPAGAIALFAANEAGYANLIKLSSRAFLGPEPDRAVPHQDRRARGAWAGPDRADRRPAGSDRHGLARRPDGPCARPPPEAPAHVRRPPLHRASAPWLAVRGGRRAAADRARLRARLPARRHQRGLFRDPRRLRGPRRAALHRRGPHRRRGQSPPRDARALLQDRRRDGRRRSPISPRRSKTRSRSPSAAPSARRAARRSCRASSRRRPEHSDADQLAAETAELKRQAEEGLRDTPRGATAGIRLHRGGLLEAASPSRSRSSPR